MLYDNHEQLNQLSRKFETSMFELRNLEYRRMQSSSKDEIAEIEKSIKTVTDEMHVFQTERRAIIEQEEEEMCPEECCENKKNKDNKKGRCNNCHKWWNESKRTFFGRERKCTKCQEMFEPETRDEIRDKNGYICDTCIDVFLEEDAREEDSQEEEELVVDVVDDRIYRAHREMGNVQGPHAVISWLKEYLEENPDDKKVTEVYELFNASNKLLEIASGLLDKIM